MRTQLARPYAQRSFEELGRNAEALVALNPKPSEWGGWDEFAREAARAANAHDEEHALRAGSECHRSYRRVYVERYRGRELTLR